MEDCCSRACPHDLLSLLCYITQDNLPGNGTTYRGLGPLPSSSVNQEKTHSHSHRPAYWGNSSAEAPSTQVILVCRKLARLTNPSMCVSTWSPVSSAVWGRLLNGLEITQALEVDILALLPVNSSRLSGGWDVFSRLLPCLLPPPGWDSHPSENLKPKYTLLSTNCFKPSHFYHRKRKVTDMCQHIC